MNVKLADSDSAVSQEDANVSGVVEGDGRVVSGTDSVDDAGPDSVGDTGSGGASDVSSGDGFDSLPSEWQRTIKELRRESAQRRTALRELEKKLADAKTQDDIDAAIEASKSREAELERELLRERLSRGLPDNLREFVSGDTEEDIKASVEKVRAAFKPRVGTDVTGVTPSGGVKPSEDDLSNLSPRELAKRVRDSMGRRI